jgi:hypothetical protein
MSLIIFFGLAFFIFVLGIVIMSVTFYHWYKLAKEAKAQKKLAVRNQ